MEKEIIDLIELMRRQEQSLKRFESKNIDLIRVRDQMLYDLKGAIKIAMDFLHLKNDETYYMLQRKYNEVSNLYYQNYPLLKGVRNAGEIDDKIKEVKKYIQAQHPNPVNSETKRSSLAGMFHGGSTSAPELTNSSNNRDSELASLFKEDELSSSGLLNGDSNNTIGPSNDSLGSASLFKAGNNCLSNDGLKRPSEQNCDSLQDNVGLGFIIEFIDQALQMVDVNEISLEYIENLILSVCGNFEIRDPEMVRAIVDERILSRSQDPESHCK